MNNETLELANKIKSSVKANQGSANTCIPNSDLLSICNEIEKINSLELVGYMESNGIDYINQHGFTHINAEQSDSRNIPLYKLD